MTSSLTNTNGNRAIGVSTPEPIIPAQFSPSSMSTNLKRSRAESRATDSCPSSAPSTMTSSPEKTSRERLLFLLEVASNPAMSSVSRSCSPNSPSPKPKSTIPAPPLVQAQQPAAPSAAPVVDPEEERKKRRRVEYAMTVLNAGSSKAQKTLNKAVEEAKKKRAEISMASLTGEKKTFAPIEYDVAKSQSKASGSTAAKSKATESKTTTAAAKTAVVDASKAPSPKRRHIRKRTFAEKLLSVLSNPHCTDAVAWLPAGDAFIVVSPKAFVGRVLPQYFKTAKFESFTRKLNRWGFKRISQIGTCAVAYKHEFFLRDEPQLCKKMSGGKRDGEEGEPEPERQPRSLVQPQQAQAQFQLQQLNFPKTVQPQQQQLPITKTIGGALPGANLRQNHLITLAKLAPPPSSAGPAAGGLHGMLSRLGASGGLPAPTTRGAPAGPKGSQYQQQQDAVPSSMAALKLSQQRVVANAEARRQRFRETLRRAAHLSADPVPPGSVSSASAAPMTTAAAPVVKGSAYYQQRMAEISSLYSSENKNRQVPQREEGGSYLRRIRQAQAAASTSNPQQATTALPPMPSSRAQAVKERDLRLVAHMRLARAAAAPAPLQPPPARAPSLLPPAPVAHTAPQEFNFGIDSGVNSEDAATAMQMQRFRLRQMAALRARHAARMRAAAHAHVQAHAAQAQQAQAQARGFTMAGAQQNVSAHSIHAAALTRIAQRTGISAGGAPFPPSTSSA